MELNRDALVVFHKKWFSTATPVNAVKASKTTAFITANSNIKYESKLVGTEGNDYTVQYVYPEDADEALSVELVGKDLIVNLETDDTAVTSKSSIGTYDNDGVDTPLIALEVIAAGKAGNTYTVEVVAPTEGTSALAVALTESALVVTLAAEDGDTDIAGNAASTIATAIEAVEVDSTQIFNATPVTGQETTRILVDEDEKNFTGGYEGTIVTIANDIIDAIDEDDEISAILNVTLAQALGTGLVSKLAQVNLENGQYATPCKATNALIEIDGTKYYTTKAVDKFSETGWNSIALTEL